MSMHDILSLPVRDQMVMVGFTGVFSWCIWVLIEPYAKKFGKWVRRKIHIYTHTTFPNRFTGPQ